MTVVQFVHGIALKFAGVSRALNGRGFSVLNRYGGDCECCSVFHCGSIGDEKDDYLATVSVKVGDEVFTALAGSWSK